MNVLLARADAVRLPLPDRSVDLVFGSPPYCDARSYGIDAQRDCREWVAWMLGVTAEAVRVSRGLVLWVVGGVTRDHCYWPACEGLLWRWWEQGGQCWRPAYWHRVGIPGSGGKKWLRADVEYVLAFKGRGNDFWTDNTAMGHPPKWAPGGEMSHRLTDGERRNQWGHSGTGLRAERRTDGSIGTAARPSHVVASKNVFGVRTDVPVGSRATGRKKAGQETYRADKKGPHDVASGERRINGEVQSYAPPVLANPGTYHTWDFDEAEAEWLDSAVQHVTVGGGHLGSKHAHENEAPFPEALAEFFVRSFCPPAGIVLDPFSGSATTVAVARRHGRRGIGFDLRASQCTLGTARLAEPEARPTVKPKRHKAAAGQQTLFGLEAT